ncbi:TELO2-interacting protein 1 isoform X1 [Capsicum galapagoense]
MEGASGDESGAIFSELKHYCIELLELHQNPTKNHSTLSRLLQFLRRSSPDVLQSFFDYTLFPLLLLLDAAVDSRSSPKVDSNERFMRPNALSDIVMEGALHCLEELLKKCYLGSVDQFIVLTKKLTRGALLSAMEASEEFREGVIRCFKALLLNMHCCSSDSCPCKQTSGWPLLLETKSLHSSPVSKLKFKEEECLVAFLQSETASVAVGHWLSLLLKVADVEAARGQQGSASLRIKAFSTLRILVAKAGTADALAFFLPGFVSQIGKVLHISRTFISGAAGSAEALDQAIRSLAEFLMIVLEDNLVLPFLCLPLDDVKKEKSSLSFLEALRQLPSTMHDQNLSVVVDKGSIVLSSTEGESVSPRNMTGSLRVIRAKDWIVDTSSHVDKLLCATYPHLCMHPSRKVRRGLLAAIQGLLSKTSCVLKGSRLMLLESLCVLACDDSEEVSSASQLFFGHLLSSHEKLHIKHDVSEIFSRLVEKLPKVVLGTDELYAIAHSQKLLALIYISGPQLVADYLLQSPVRIAQFLDVLALCLSQNSVFSGSLKKNVVAKRSSSGFMHSIAEIRAVRAADSENLGNRENQNRKVHATESITDEHQLPRMPPWFVDVGSQKLYDSVAGILRLLGLSLFADSRSEGPLSVIIDLPLENLRKLVSEIRMKEYSEESWQSWYSRITSGQLVRQASAAVCILNELIFGLSDQAIDEFTRMFREYVTAPQENKKCQEDASQYWKIEQSTTKGSVWKICQAKGERSHLVDCIGNILHEYLSPEIWNLPVEHTTSLQQYDCEDANISSHFFNDNVMLHQEIHLFYLLLLLWFHVLFIASGWYCVFHIGICFPIVKQVIIDGIGIFSMCIGRDFSSSGFLHSSLYMLLHNLICSHFQIRRASDAVLHIIAVMHDYPTVGHLVIANSDYIVDSLCRQLRSLELNPDVPNVLAAMLSYIGVAHSILPLLEEPMRAVSMELELLGRHQHPDLTIPFLKAMAEIVKASKQEASALLDQAKSYCEDVESRKLNLEKRKEKLFDDSGSYSDENVDKGSSESGMRITDDVHMQIEWETMLFKMNDFRRFRQTVGSIAGSCLTAATPLLASANQAASLVALDVVDDVFLTITKVEDAYKHEKEIKEAIEHVVHMCSFYSLKDALDADADESTENRLLPAANKVWPFLVSCLRNKSPLAVRRCTHTISNIVQICGGDFFTRRFHTDGKYFWSFLSTSPFQKRAPGSSEETHLRLPYQGGSASLGDSAAEISDLKIQVAVLNMLANLAGNKRSASALEAVLKKASGLVVGIACSGVVGLRDASINVLAALASIDPDLIWILFADVYYSKKREMPIAPTPGEFLEMSQILPPPLSSKDYLYWQYGGKNYGFDIDFTSVETVFRTLHSQFFSSRMYS